MTTESTLGIVAGWKWNPFRLWFFSVATRTGIEEGTLALPCIKLGNLLALPLNDLVMFGFLFGGPVDQGKQILLCLLNVMFSELEMSGSLPTVQQRLQITNILGCFVFFMSAWPFITVMEYLTDSTFITQPCRICLDFNIRSAHDLQLNNDRVYI
jgi:hypothetical protein